MEKTAKRIAPFIIALMVLVAFFGAMNFGSLSFAAGETVKITTENSTFNGVTVDDFKPVGTGIPTDGTTFYAGTGTDVRFEFGGLDVSTLFGNTYSQELSHQLIFEFWFYSDSVPTFGYHFGFVSGNATHQIDPNNPADQTSIHTNYVPYTWQKFSVAMRGFAGAFGGTADDYDGNLARMFFNAGNSNSSEIYLYNPLFRKAEDGEKTGEKFSNNQFIVLGESVNQPASSIKITGKGIEKTDTGYALSKYYRAASFELNASADSLATNKAVTWTSGDNTIAEVTSEGVVTMKGKAGSVTLTATSVSTPSVKANLVLTAYDTVNVDVESVSIGATTAPAEKGGAIQLTASVSPSNADDDSITWSISEGSTLANVTSDGLVTFTGTGTVKVKATSYNGKFDEITFNVEEPAPKYLNLEAKYAKGGWSGGTNSTTIPNLDQDGAPEYSFQVSKSFLNGGSWNWFAKGVDSTSIINSGNGVVEFYVYFGGPKGSSNIQFALFCGSDSTLQTNSNDGAKFWGASETQMVWNEAGWYKVQIPLAGTTIAHNNIALGGVFHASAAFNYDILIYGARVLTDDTVTEFTMTKTALTSVANDLRSIEADGLTVTEGMVTVEKINSKPAASTLTGDSFKMVYEGGTGSSKVVYTFDNPIDLTNYKDGDIYVEFWIYKQSAFRKQQAPNPETEEIAINNLGIYFNRGNGSFYAHELSHKYEAPDGPQTEFDLIETGEWTHMIMEMKRGPFGGAGTDGENELTSMEFRFDAVDDNDIVAIQGMRFYIKPATSTFEHVGTLNYKKLETEAVNTTVAISDEVAAEAKVNDKVTLKADLSNDILGQANVEWSVNDTELAQIRSGKITYLKAGTVEITAKIGDSTDTKSVTVTTVPVTQITVTAPSGHSTAVGTTFKLTASVAPENATDASVTWSSSDAAKATIDAATGEVTLVAAGEVTFTATAKDGSGVTGTYKVTVTEYISATGITLDKTTASGKVGDTVTLTATVTPSNSDDVVEWSTSDASVATVENGVVTFHKAGTVTITAKAGDKTATCAVTVNAEEDNGGNGGDTEKGGLSTGAIIGIVAACVVVVGGGLAAFFLTRKKNA